MLQHLSVDSYHLARASFTQHWALLFISWTTWARQDAGIYMSSQEDNIKDNSIPPLPPPMLSELHRINDSEVHIYNIMDVGSFSHTIDHVGERFCTPHLTEFVSAWINLFSHSHKARLVRQSRTGI